MRWLSRTGWILAAAVVLAAAGGPWIAEYLVRVEVARVAKRLGRGVTVDRVRVGWGSVDLYSLAVDGAGGLSPVVVPRARLRVRMGPLAHGRVEVTDLLVEHPRAELVRGGEGDNVSSILDRLRGGSAEVGGRAGAGRLRVERVRVVDGAVAVSDETFGELELDHVEGELHTPGESGLVLDGVAARSVAGPRLAAKRLVVNFTLEHGRPTGVPIVTIEGGSASPFRGLDLTGIAGQVRPDPIDGARAVVEVRGSYGGSDTPLWQATGWLDPEREEGQLKVKAARFRLSQLASVWKQAEDGVARVLNPRAAEVDAHLDLNYSAGTLRYGGSFHLAGLTLAHPMLAPVPVHHLGFDARASGSLDFRARRLKIDQASVDYRNVHAKLTADVENIGPKPRFAATLQVQPLPCQTVLEAFPPELTPALQGFKLDGTFSTDLHLGIDFADLDAAIDLGGLVGIEECAAVSAPPAVDAQRLLATFEQTVEVEHGKWMTFFAGPENPEFVPYDQISPHLVNSIMTTEDSNFFSHKGFIPAEFRMALQQNLQKGYFRVGASSITMQMVKNVLLTREKTLSRKLQEMFLTWYLERGLSKQRILEIYFNVIEFGPGIYGIGRAARHYFGKSAHDLQPQEAAFFSSILPNPKRRYVQYCRADGTLDPKWDAYIKRIMKRSHERGRLTDVELELATTTPILFDRAEAMSEKDCLALVKRLTTPPGVPVTPQVNASAHH